MIRLSNGYEIEYVAASGALAYDGLGWPWEWPLRWCGWLDPKLFIVVTKTLTYEPRCGNLRWWKPWECIKLLPDGGTVNKVGLTNPGFRWWIDNIGCQLDREMELVVSIHGTEMELKWMADDLSHQCPGIIAIEVNPSCPNTGQFLIDVEAIVRQVELVKQVSRYPVLVKLSVAQDYVAIAKKLVGVVEATSLNSVPWESVFPGQRSPLWKLEQKVGGGGGGVSGKPAQALNWKAVAELTEQVPEIPVIAPSVMCFDDLARVRKLGASAVSFGAIFLHRPWMPTAIVRKDLENKKEV